MPACTAMFVIGFTIEPSQLTQRTIQGDGLVSNKKIGGGWTTHQGIPVACEATVTLPYALSMPVVWEVWETSTSFKTERPRSGSK